MKKYKIITLFLAIALLTFNACKEETIDPTIPEIVFDFSSPEDTKSYELGDTISIAGMVSWELEMHGYEVILKNETTDSVVFMRHEHLDGKMYHFEEFWVNNVSKTSNMKLTIAVTKDHFTAEEVTKEIMFTCNPL